MSLPWPLLVLLVWERAGDGWVLGVAGAARMLPYVALSWAAGRLADRYARDRIVRLTLRGAARAALRRRRRADGRPDLARPRGRHARGRGGHPGVPGPRRRHARTGRAADRARDRPAGDVRGGVVRGRARPSVGCCWRRRPGRWCPGSPSSAWSRPGCCSTGCGCPPAVGGRDHDGRTACWPRCATSAVLRGAVAAVAVVNAVAASRGPGPASAQPRPGTARARARRSGSRPGRWGFGALGGPVLGRIAARWRLGPRVWLARAGRLPGGRGVPAPSLWVAVPLLTWSERPPSRSRSWPRRTCSGAAPDRLRASVLGLTDTAMVAAALLGALVAPVAGRRDSAPGVVVLVAAAGSVAAVLLVRRPVVRPATVGGTAAQRCLTNTVEAWTSGRRTPTASRASRPARSRSRSPTRRATRRSCSSRPAPATRTRSRWRCSRSCRCAATPSTTC